MRQGRAQNQDARDAIEEVLSHRTPRERSNMVRFGMLIVGGLLTREQAVEALRKRGFIKAPAERPEVSP